MTNLARQSVERLFAEPFEPQWMVARREATVRTQVDEYNRWRKLVVERSNLAWRLEAVKSHERIVAERVAGTQRKQ